MNQNCGAKPTRISVAGNPSETIEMPLLVSRGRPAVSRLDNITDWETRAEQVRFSVGALAKGCGVTDRQLRRYFQSKYGSSPHVWLTLRRLQRAQPHLLDGDLVKEAAAKVGFSNPEVFSRRFRRFYKCLPALLHTFL